MKYILSVFVFLFSLLIAGNAMAKFTYEGHLTDLSDNPLSYQSAIIRLAIVPPGTVCVLFMETHTVTTDGKGFFSVQVGGGTDADGLPSTLDDVFSNLATINGMASCTYTPTAGDARRLKIEVDTTGTYEALGFIALGKSPQAAHADAVGGFDATKLVRTSSGTAPLLSPSDVTALTQLIAGTSGLYAAPGGSITGVTGTLPISSSGGATPNITISQASASGAGYLTSADWTTFSSKLGPSAAASGDLSGTLTSATIAKIQGRSVSAGAPTPGQVLTYSGSTWSPATPVTAPVASVNGRIGAVVIISSDISGFLGTAAYKSIGNSAGTVAAGDDSRIVSALSTALTNGQAFIGNGSNLAVSRNIFLGDIRSSITPANPAFTMPGGCSAGDTVTYSSLSGDFSCQPYGLTNGQVSSALGFTPLAASGPLLMPDGSFSNPTYSFSSNSSTGIFSPSPGEIGFSSASSVVMKISNVPSSMLSVFGTMRATSISGSHFDNSGLTTIDFSQGNFVTSSHNCVGNFSLQNMRDGGTYKIVVLGGVGNAQCDFNTTVSGIDPPTVVYKFNPANAARNASSDDTLYELNRFGNTVYVNWMRMYP